MEHQEALVARQPVLAASHMAAMSTQQQVQSGCQGQGALPTLSTPPHHHRHLQPRRNWRGGDRGGGHGGCCEEHCGVTMPVCMTVTLWDMLGQSVALPNGDMPTAMRSSHPAAANGRAEIELGSMGHYASHCSIASCGQNSDTALTAHSCLVPVFYLHPPRTHLAP